MKDQLKKKKIISLVLETDRPNHNKRVYPRAVVLKAFEEYEQKIKLGSAIGYLNSDDSISPTNLTNASHIVVGTKECKKGIKVSFRPLNTPMGQVLSGLVPMIKKLRLHLRGYGIMKGNIVKDLQLISCDVTHV